MSRSISIILRREFELFLFGTLFSGIRKRTDGNKTPTGWIKPNWTNPFGANGKRWERCFLKNIFLDGDTECCFSLVSRVPLFATPWTAACQASLSTTNSRRLLKLVSIESVMSSSQLILCCSLLPPSIFPSIRVFSNESVLLVRWPRYWSFSFSISPSNEYSGLIFFRIDWLDLLAVQGTLKSLLQHHSSKASILRCSAFFIVQLSHPYMTTGKTIALTRQTFVGKVMLFTV